MSAIIGVFCQCVELKSIDSDAEIDMADIPIVSAKKDQFKEMDQSLSMPQPRPDQMMTMPMDASTLMERMCLDPDRGDPRCPPLSCDMYQSYLIKSTVDEKICFLQKYAPKASNCFSLGICHRSEDTYCEASELLPTTVSIPINDECIEMEGCQDQMPGKRKYRVDFPCQNGQGICNLQGQCEGASAQMANVFACDETQFPNYRSNGLNEICPIDPNLMNVCEFYINKEGFHPGNAALNCQDFCAKYQTRCLEAWDNQPNTKCNKADPITCDVGGNDRICRCGPL